jgi:licheninase
MTYELKRGITIDRQYYLALPSPNFQPGDIELVKSMGFDFVKLIVNPAVHKSTAAIINMGCIDAMVNRVLKHNMQVVVCIHPESNFKNTVFKDKQEFRNLCRWYAHFVAYLAARWSQKDLIFQLMTEPFGSSPDPESWNSWNKLQPPMWQAVRQAMPDHTLILSGDRIGRIEGLVLVEPVRDNNVIYAFSHYEPFIFTLQGASWAAQEFGAYIPHIQHVPYPSSPEIIELALSDILRNVPADLQDQATGDLKQYGTEGWNKNKMTERIRTLTDWSRSYGGVKLLCGEFGCLHGAVHPQHRYQFIRDFREVLEEHGISWAYWSFNETFRVLDAGKPDAQMLGSLFG